MDDQDNQAYRDLWKDLRVTLARRKFTMALVFVATVMAGYGAISLLTERYEAQGRLLVTLGRENAEVPLTVEKGTVHATGVRKEETNSYIQLLSSRSLVEETIDDIGLERFDFKAPPPTTLFQKFKHIVKGTAKWTRRQINGALIFLDLRKRIGEREKVIQLVLRGLQVERERDSNVILISFQLPDPQLAKHVIEVMVENYMRRHIAVRNNADILSVFYEQTEVYRKEVEAQQNAASEIKRKWNLSSVDDQRVQLLSRLHILKRSVDETNTLVKRLENEQQLRRDLLQTLPQRSQDAESVGPNPRVEAIKERMAELQLRRVRTASRYFDDSEMVQTIDREIESLQTLLSAEDPTQMGEVKYRPHPLTKDFLESVEHTRVQLAGMDAALQVQQTQVATIEEELQNLNEGEDKLRMVDLQREVAEQKYFTYATRREEARIAQLFDAHGVANVTLLSEPTAGAIPVYPRKMLMMGVTIATGLMLGVAFAMLLERRRPIIYSGEDLADFPELPVLGMMNVE